MLPAKNSAVFIVFVVAVSLRVARDRLVGSHSAVMHVWLTK
jgi:hypothetical protein